MAGWDINLHGTRGPSGFEFVKAVVDRLKFFNLNGLVYRGLYDSDLIYLPNDVVWHNDALWVALSETGPETAEEPSDEAVAWELHLDFRLIAQQADETENFRNEAEDFLNQTGTLYQQFSSLFLGSHSVAPEGPHQNGAFYFDTTTEELYIWRNGEFEILLEGPTGPIASPSAWTPATQYEEDDLVFFEDKFYKSLEDHLSSSTFDNAKWEEIADFTLITAAAIAAQAAAEAASSAAADSQTAAAGSATSAATSSASAVAAFASFDIRYLGEKATNPTLDNSGGALAEGALYWNSTVKELRVFNGTTWIAVSNEAKTALLQRLIPAPSIKTAAYTVQASDWLGTIRADASGLAANTRLPITLPSLSTLPDGFSVEIVKEDAGLNFIDVIAATGEHLGGRGPNVTISSWTKISDTDVRFNIADESRGRVLTDDTWVWISGAFSAANGLRQIDRVSGTQFRLKNFSHGGSAPGGGTAAYTQIKITLKGQGNAVNLFKFADRWHIKTGPAGIIEARNFLLGKNIFFRGNAQDFRAGPADFAYLAESLRLYLRSIVISEMADPAEMKGARFAIVNGTESQYPDGPQIGPVTAGTALFLIYCQGSQGTSSPSNPNAVLDGRSGQMVWTAAADFSPGSYPSILSWGNTRTGEGHTTTDLWYDNNLRWSHGEKNGNAKWELSLLSTDNQPAMRVNIRNPSYTGIVHRIAVDRNADAGHDILRINSGVGSGGTPTTPFRLRGDGNAFATGVWNSNADYAEWFETSNGKQIPPGTVVILDKDGKVRPVKTADSDEDILGVIRPRTGTGVGVVGDAAEDNWRGMFLTDDFGETTREEVEYVSWVERVPNITRAIRQPRTPQQEEAGLPGTQTGEEVIDFRLESHCYPASWVKNGSITADKARFGKAVKVPKDAERITRLDPVINPDYDPNKPYVPRSQRDEWVLVGLLGKAPVLAGQRVSKHWRKIKALSPQTDQYLIRG